MEKKIGRVVITGPTGAIGMALIACCIKQNIEVVAVVNPNSNRKKRMEQFPGMVVIERGIEEYHTLDLCKELKEKKENCNQEDTKCDVWIHLAWMGAAGTGRNDVFLQNQNVKCLLDALEAAKRAGCHTFLGAGSQAEYGLCSEKIGEQTPTKPFTGYGVAKLCAGQMGCIRAEQIGIQFIWTRICSIYGPYDGENSMLISAIRKMQAGQVPVFTKGEQEWDYLYSEDAANMLLKLLFYGKHGRVYVIGGGTARPLKQYIEQMRKAVEQIMGVNAQVHLGEIPYRENQVMYLCADISAFLEDVKSFFFTTFEEGIKNTVLWCKESVEGLE